MEGHWAPSFSRVRELFAEELSGGNACGLALGIVVGGRTVVHLWGGYRDAARTMPWMPDTLVCLFSASKPLVAVTVLKLIEQGLLELDQPVARYWPEFAAGGKGNVSVRQVLAHLAGIPATPDTNLESVYDRGALVRAVEQQAPIWPPGSQGCFHSFTYGVIAGELVRRVTGRPFGEVFRQHLSRRFDGGFAFSLNQAEQCHCAEMILPADNALLAMMCSPETMLGRSWQPMPWQDLNTAAFRGCDFPSIAGQGSAVGLARFHGMMANGGVMDGERVLDEDLVNTALTEHWQQFDPFMGAPVRMGLGFMLSNPVFPFTGNPSSFAQPGLGGVVGLGDRDLRLGIGITPNLLSAGLQDPFLDQLIAVTLECL